MPKKFFKKGRSSGGQSDHKAKTLKQIAFLLEETLSKLFRHQYGPYKCDIKQLVFPFLIMLYA